MAQFIGSKHVWLNDAMMALVNKLNNTTSLDRIR